MNGLPVRESSLHNIMHSSCLEGNTLFALPAPHEVMFVKICKLCGIKNIPAMREGRQIKLQKKPVVERAKNP
jgi:hypothetical protein